MDTADIHWLSLVEVGERIAAGEISSLAVTGEMLTRVELLDPTYRAFAEVTDERAFVAARQADAEIGRGLHRGPLHGVPIAVKALCDVAGETNAAGTLVLADRTARKNATVVRRLEAAGAIVLGTLTMTEGASAVHHPAITPPINPWDPEAWTGASSSGSGVAVAAGLCFGALGSDTAGSIRVPSHFCGVTGLKPTYGRVSRAGVFPLSASLDHIGPMARSAADCAAMLHVIAGADPRDPSASPVPVPDYLTELAPPLEGFRIGLDERYLTEQVAPQLADAIDMARRVLERAGAAVVPLELPELDEPLHAGATLLHADVAYAHAELYSGNEASYGPHLTEIIEIGRRLSGVDVARALDQGRDWRGRLDRVLSEVDALIAPPSPAAAPPARLTTALSGDFFSQAPHFRFTLPFTLSGHPALTVPCGFNERGLPLAFQLIGGHFCEAALLRAGHHYQQHTEWHQMHPSA